MQLRYRAATAVVLTILAAALASRSSFRPTLDPGVHQHMLAFSVPAGAEPESIAAVPDHVAAALKALPRMRHVQHQLPEPGALIDAVLPHFTLMLSPSELDRAAAKLTTASISAAVRRNRLVLESPQSVAAKELVEHDPFNLLPIFLQKFGGGEGFEFNVASGLLASPDGSTVLVVAQPAVPASDLRYGRMLMERSAAVGRDASMSIVGDYAEALQDVEIARRWAAAAVFVIVLLIAVTAWALRRSAAAAIDGSLAAAVLLLLAAGWVSLLSVEIPIPPMPGNEARARGKAIERRFGVTAETRTVVVEGASLSEVLDRTAAATRSLKPGSWSAITQFIPPAAEQERSIELLRAGRADGRFSPQRIRADFAAALSANGFRPDAYDGYMRQFEQALTASEPLTLEQLRGEHMEMLRDRFIRKTPRGYESLISVTADLK